MAFKDYLIRNKRAIRNTALALVAIGAASYGILKKDCLTLPDREKATLAQRINPFDTLKNIPEALRWGYVGTLVNVDYTLKSGDVKNHNTATAYAISKGIISTSLDMTLNAISWPVKEIDQAISGETFKQPYVPFTESSRLITGILF